MTSLMLPPPRVLCVIEVSEMVEVTWMCASKEYSGPNVRASRRPNSSSAGLRLQRLMRTLCTLWLALNFCYCFCGKSLGASAHDQTPAATNAPPAQTNSPASFALADVAAQAQSTLLDIGTLESDLSADKTLATISASLEEANPEIAARLEEEERLVSPTTSLDTLQYLANEWDPLHDKLSSWQKLVAKRLARLKEHLTQLEQLQTTWRKTQQSIANQDVPAAVRDQIQDVLDRVNRAAQELEVQQAALLVLQGRVAAQNSRVTERLISIEQAREKALKELLVQDSPPLWTAVARSRSAPELMVQERDSYSRQFAALQGYWNREREAFLLHGLLFVALCSLLLWMGKKLRRQAAAHPDEQPCLADAALIFEMPIATGLVLSFLAARWIYPEAPRLLWALLGAVALVPAGLLVRRILARRLLPLLYTLLVFYFLDQLRLVSAAQPLLTRFLLLAEMLGATVVLGCFVGPRHLAEPVETERVRFRKALLLGVRFALWFSGLALAANVLGYMKLGKLLANAVLGSSYLALALFAAVSILDGFISGLLSSRPLCRVPVVQRHHDLLQERARRLLGAVALVLWIFYVLDAFSLRLPVFHGIQQLLALGVALRSVKFTLADVLLFFIAVWASFLVSRFLRFILEEEVYPHIQLAPGLHYSISRIVHYAVLLVGFLIGVGLLGFPLTKLTIVASAVGVGVGFGLQNIINNFVSGIILLFERPIKLGDVIQLDNTEGVVKRIGIRASVVKTVSGSEIIVPNSKLISDPVTNWTFSARQRPIEIAISVAGGTDPRRVLELLNRVAAADPRVTHDPPPRALFLNFSGGGLNFALRAWTDATTDWVQVRSDLSMAISSALATAGIAIH